MKLERGHTPSAKTAPGQRGFAKAFPNSIPSALLATAQMLVPTSAATRLFSHLRVPALVTAVKLLAMVQNAHSANAKLAWDPSESAPVDRAANEAGTNIFWWGKTPGIYPNRRLLPRDAEGASVNNLLPAETYVFVVQYANSTGSSEFSNMVPLTTPMGPRPVEAITVTAVLPPPIDVPPTTTPPTTNPPTTTPPTTTPTEPPTNPPTTTPTTIASALNITPQEGGALVQVVGQIGQRVVLQQSYDLVNWSTIIDLSLGVDQQYTHYAPNTTDQGDPIPNMFFRAYTPR